MNDRILKTHRAHRVKVSVRAVCPKLIVSLLYLETWHKNACDVGKRKVFFFFFILSDSAVSTHAPSSALQEIRREKRLTAQFHKTQPRHHFIFSEPIFFLFIYLFYCFLGKKSKRKGGGG